MRPRRLIATAAPHTAHIESCPSVMIIIINSLYCLIYLPLPSLASPCSQHVGQLSRAVCDAVDYIASGHADNVTHISYYTNLYFPHSSIKLCADVDILSFNWFRNIFLNIERDNLQKGISLGR